MTRCELCSFGKHAACSQPTTCACWCAAVPHVRTAPAARTRVAVVNSVRKLLRTAGEAETA